MVFLEKNKEKGQVAVEYMLLILVLVSVMVGIMGKVKIYLIGTQSCEIDSRPLACTIDRMFDSDSNNPNANSRFRSFNLYGARR